MYNEAKSPILAILITAIIVGGGMYWYNNKNVESVVEEPEENEVVIESEEEVVVPAPIVEETPSTETAPVVENEAESEVLELTAETVFEPQTFTNKIYKYSIDFPKNWYWHHYGIVNGMDYASFDSTALPETLGSEYAGKIVVMVGMPEGYSSVEAMIAEQEKWLNNVTKRIHIYAEAWSIIIVRGEMPEDGLSMGSSNVRMSAYFAKDGKLYIMSVAGPTPEEEKIFEQMVASFRFEE
ncbi:MAG: hypothetical protein Q8P68_03660 [Candidatus Peregrinibacteria bacterium]|nr:hypothetical protein [Candidatus Peregrinibacteria bacterium]MDZ4244745.1 hypothetical protein [Candidatus Gracilibacteria bacterium]